MPQLAVFHKRNNSSFHLSRGSTTTSIPANWECPNSVTTEDITTSDVFFWNCVPVRVDTGVESRCLTEGGDFFNFQPIEIREFVIEDEVYRLKEPLVIEPEYDMECKLFVLKDDSYGIDIYASTIPELRQELNYELVFLWKAYAQGNPADMTSQASLLRSNLLSAVC